MINKNKVFVAGHAGMVGSAIVRALSAAGYENVLVRSRDELDLIDQKAVSEFFLEETPDEVYLAAAKVGGIHANSQYPAEFIYENLMVQTNVIHSAFTAGVKKVLFLGSSCIYPRLADQPIGEEALLRGPLEETNEPYAIAKIAGIKLCESYNRQYGQTHGIDYRSIMPTNLFGPGDNYHPENSHVIPALLNKFHIAHLEGLPSVEIWGTGTPKREFLHVDDLAAAALHCMNLQAEVLSTVTSPNCTHLNVGAGSDISIKDLAVLIGEVVGFKGDIIFDVSKPDGTPRKLMNSNKLMSTGWRPSVTLREGLQDTYQSFLRQHIARGLRVK